MPSWKKVITSGSDAELNSLYAPSITGSLHGTASNAVTASYVNPLQQTVLVTGSLIISSSNNTNDFRVGTNKLFVSASGNVGIGTTTPTQGTLQVNGNVFATSFTGSLFGTASYYVETDPIFVAKSGSLATTGSNTFVGNQNIQGLTRITGTTSTDLVRITSTGTGNAFVVEDSTNPDSSPFVIDSLGSVGIGKETPSVKLDILGNTTITGSLNVSGSTLFKGIHTLSGSNTITGNTVLSGSLEVSGSSNFKNSIFVVTGSTHFKGIHTISGSTEITGSFNVIDGDINIVSGSSFTRWGNKLFNYGQFSSNETQSGSANTAYAMKFNTNDNALNVHIVSSSRITVDNTGIYNLQFSTQLGNTANTAIDFDIWFAYTGSNVANSNTQITLNKTPGTVGRLVASWNFITPIYANDYIEIMWSCTGVTGQLQSQGTQTGPTRPAIPSVIATLTQIA